MKIHDEPETGHNSEDKTAECNCHHASQKAELQSELFEIREKYNRLFLGNPQPMLIYDIETLAIKEVNQAAVDLYGYSYPEFMLMTIMNIRPKSEIPKLNSHLQGKCHPKSAGIWQHVKKNGNVIYVKVISHDIVHNGRPSRHVMLNDVTKIKQAQKSLIVSEQRIRSVLDNMLEGCQIIGFDWKYKYINQTALEHCRGKRSDFIGRLFTDCWPGSTSTKIYSAVKRCMEGRKPVKLEGQFIYPDRSRAWFSCSIQPVPEGVFILSVDISDRKLMEKSLISSEEKFRTLFDNHSAIKLIIEAETGNITEANPAAAIFYGWSRQELQSMNINQINSIGAENMVQLLDTVRKNLKNNFNFKHRRKDGTTCDVEVFSSKITISGKEYIHSIVQDVSAKMKAEKQVSLLSKSIEHSPVGIIITDPEGCVEFCNNSFTQLTGYQPAEVIGVISSLLRPSRDQKSRHHKIWKAVRLGNIWKGEFCDWKKNGEQYWTYVSISPMFGSHGSLEHLIMVFEDISDHKKMLAQLIESKLKAEESDKLKTAFLANMSHEIRTPMNGILGFMDLLQQSDITGSEREEYISYVKLSGERLLNTINDIIHISKIESGITTLNETTFSINSLLNEHLKFFLPEAETKKLGLSVSSRLNEEDDIVIADRQKIESILTNLIKNALKFTATGSVTFGCILHNNILRFSVSDTGAGIPADKVVKIFDRFVQAEYNFARTYEGSGLGLAISKGYAEMMGGNIIVRSDHGKGSVFTFTIPHVRANAAIIPAQKSAKIETVRSETLQVLVAEDDDVSFTYLHALISKHKIKLLRANNGAEAVQMCKDNPSVALIFMDIKMPVMDGYEATRRIREFHPDLPVIALTAFALSNDRIKALDAGCDDYISKPVRKEMVFEILERFTLWNNDVVVVGTGRDLSITKQ